MGHFSFQREAKWMLWITLALPVLAMLVTIVVPALMRWWAGR